MPEGYKLPESNSFMKFVSGKNRFRILSSLVTGEEYWDVNNKPVRSREPFVETPNAKEGEDGKVDIKHFWAVVVWNYATESIQILEITQRGIQKYITGLISDPAWGSPKGYDLVVTREGDGLATKYTVAANPHKEMDPEIIKQYEESGVTAESLFEN